MFTLENIMNWLSVAGQVVGAAAAVAAIVPQAKGAGPIIQTARQVLDVVALNVNNAKNARKP